MKANYHDGTQQEIQVEDNGSQKIYHLKKAMGKEEVKGYIPFGETQVAVQGQRFESVSSPLPHICFKNKDRKPLGK